MSLIDKIAAAGVVGAGGAGFPTHVKYNTKAEYLIINGAECEPLLRSDKFLMSNFPEEIIETMKDKTREEYGEKESKEEESKEEINPEDVPF